MERSQKGAGLLLALMILALLSLLVGAMLTAVTLEVQIGDNYRTETQLLYLTEAGIEEGREALRSTFIAPSPLPFIDDVLSDTQGREAGRYAVTLVRSDPFLLRSVGTTGRARKTIEVRLRRSGFPRLPDAVTLNEDVPLPPGVDSRLETPDGLERIVAGIVRNATDVYSPPVGTAFPLSAIGSAADYRVVVVEGDCEFGDAAGYGILLVRGELALTGTASWNGLVLVIGQGVLRAPATTTAWISGAVFVTRTRENDRTALNPLGTLLGRRGPVTFDVSTGTVSIDHSETEMDLANRNFPLVATTFREY